MWAERRERKPQKMNIAHLLANRTDPLRSRCVLPDAEGLVRGGVDVMAVGGPSEVGDPLNVAGEKRDKPPKNERSSSFVDSMVSPATSRSFTHPPLYHRPPCRRRYRGVRVWDLGLWRAAFNVHFPFFFFQRVNLLLPGPLLMWWSWTR